MESNFPHWQQRPMMLSRVDLPRKYPASDAPSQIWRRASDAGWTHQPSPSSIALTHLLICIFGKHYNIIIMEIIIIMWLCESKDLCRIIVEELTFEMIFIPNGLLVFRVYLLSPAWKEQQVPPVELFQRHLSINLMQFLPVPVENIFPASFYKKCSSQEYRPTLSFFLWKPITGTTGKKFDSAITWRTRCAVWPESVDVWV